MSHYIGLSFCIYILSTNAGTIDMDSKWKHWSTTVWCANDEDCVVNCEYCSGYTIYCPRTPHHCTVICSTQGSCEHTRIDATSFNSQLRNLTVILNKEPFALTNSIIKCPTNHSECNILCINDRVCRNITIDGRATSHTNISLIANGTQAFYNSSIYASSYGTLDIHCNGHEACKATNPIQTDTNTLGLNIQAKGSLVLAQSNIYCPSKCNMDIQGTHAMQDSAIHAVRSFNDIHFTCDSTLGGGCTGITMFCADDSCSMQMISNTWQCVDSTNLCNQHAQVDDTTSAPYSAQTASLHIEFDYIFLSENDYNLSTNALLAIFSNISDGLINADIKRINDACVEHIDYTIDIDQIARHVVVEAMIHVCNAHTWLVFSHLADIIMDEPIYIGRDEDTTDLYADYGTNDTLDSFGIITIIFGSIVTLCIVIAVVLCCVHGRKDVDARVPRYRIDTGSKSSARAFVIQGKYEQKEESVPPVCVPGSSGPKAIRVLSGAEDEGYRLNGMKMSIDIGGVQNMQYEVVNTITPYGPEEPGSPVSLAVDEIEIVDDEETSDHGCVSVKQKGNETLESVVQGIDNRQQLEEIGVFVERDRTQILNGIKKLKDANHNKKNSEGLPRNFDGVQRSRQTSEGDANLTI
eukprot:681880_1